jgi:hypothetical protein
LEKQAIKDLVYGGVSELMRNNRYYYRSSVGRGYSKWTEQGHEALLNFMSEITHHITECEDKELDKRAKDMVLAELKK